MIIGRVGTLTVAFAFSRSARQQELQIPRRPHDGRIRASLHHQMGTPIKPYEDEAAKKAQVARMFDNIAHRYDFLNHFFSLGIDKLWRRKAIRMLLADDPHRSLDVATGTADFAIGTRYRDADIKVVGVDISAGMLDIGRQKGRQSRPRRTGGTGVGRRRSPAF